ncbi:MAG: sulfotransferase family protein [Lysobacterales bacterium]
MRRLPNFLIIGAPKSGTTALYHWLAGHPQVHLSTPKEPFFFEEEYERGPEYYWRTYFADGWRGQSLVGEARTSHLFLPYVTRRIYETVPDARLVAILRNPVERAFSHWWMVRCHGREPLGFDEALQANWHSMQDGTSLEGPEVERRWRAHIVAREEFWRPRPLSVRPYIEPGHYARHLERFLGYFPRSRLCVLLYDDLLQRPQETMARLLQFLELEGSGMRHAPAPENVALTRFSLPLFKVSRRFRLARFVPRGLLAVARTSLSKIGSRPAMSDAAREWLQNHFEPHNRRLEPLLGRDLSAWDR